jgi:hypothetical protein
MRRRHEQIIEPHLRCRRRQRQTGIRRVQEAKDVAVTGVEDNLHGAPADLAAAQPHRRPDFLRQRREVEQLARRHRVEIPHERMETFLVPLDAVQQRAELDGAPPFRPRREHGAQVHPEHPERHPLWNDLEEGVTREPRTMPLVMRDRQAAHIPERQLWHRRPMRQPSSRGQPFDNAGIRGFLEDDDVGGGWADDGQQRVLAAAAAALDVVAQEPDRQSCFSTSVR